MDQNILKKLISYDTTSSKSNLELIKFVKNNLQSCGYQTKTFKSGGKADLFAHQKEFSGPKLILASHSDTVPASNSWSSKPTKMTKKENRLIGLGAADMKSQIAISLKKAKKYRLKKNIAILITYNEETDFAGAKKIDKKIIEPRDFVVIGEPTNKKAIFETKGLLVLKISLVGKSAHGSEPKKGVSAIVDTADLISALQKEFDYFSKKNLDYDFQNPKPTLNFGKIYGGDAINKVADFCCLDIEMRFCNNKQPKELIKMIKRISQKLQSNIKIEICDKIPAFKASDKIRNFMKSVKNNKGVSFATEASIYSKLANNIVIFGPGQINQAHKPNESISILDIEAYSRKLDKLINKF